MEDSIFRGVICTALDLETLVVKELGQDNGRLIVLAEDSGTGIPLFQSTDAYRGHRDLLQRWALFLDETRGKRVYIQDMRKIRSLERYNTVETYNGAVFFMGTNRLVKDWNRSSSSSTTRIGKKSNDIYPTLGTFSRQIVTDWSMDGTVTLMDQSTMRDVVVELAGIKFDPLMYTDISAFFLEKVVGQKVEARGHKYIPNSRPIVSVFIGALDLSKYLLKNKLAHVNSITIQWRPDLKVIDYPDDADGIIAKIHPNCDIELDFTFGSVTCSLNGVVFDDSNTLAFEYLRKKIGKVVRVYFDAFPYVSIDVDGIDLATEIIGGGYGFLDLSGAIDNPVHYHDLQIAEDNAKTNHLGVYGQFTTRFEPFVKSVSSISNILVQTSTSIVSVTLNAMKFNPFYHFELQKFLRRNLLQRNVSLTDTDTDHVYIETLQFDGFHDLLQEIKSNEFASARSPVPPMTLEIGQTIHVAITSYHDDFVLSFRDVRGKCSYRKANNKTINLNSLVVVQRNGEVRRGLVREMDGDVCRVYLVDEAFLVDVSLDELVAIESNDPARGFVGRLGFVRPFVDNVPEETVRNYLKALLNEDCFYAHVIEVNPMPVIVLTIEPEIESPCVQFAILNDGAAVYQTEGHVPPKYNAFEELLLEGQRQGHTASRGGWASVE